MAPVVRDEIDAKANPQTLVTVHRLGSEIQRAEVLEFFRDCGPLVYVSSLLFTSAFFSFT